MKTLFVNGTLMKGFVLNKNLEGAEYLGTFMTKPCYRIFSINDIHPGMYETDSGGVAVEGELYRMSDEIWARVEAGEPPHLYCGPVKLADGREVDGILYPKEKIEPGFVEISAYGGWRGYMAEIEKHAPVQLVGKNTLTLERSLAVSQIFKAEPYDLPFDPDRTALLIIDMQRDFLEPGGFGAMLGNDVSLLRSAIAPCKAILESARKQGMFVLHTREGHAPDMADCPPSKQARGKLATGIGDTGPMGRILIRGETGHDIIPELYPLADEPIIDKPGKGAFFATDLELKLRNRDIKTLIVCGVTTEVCVNTTVREANDRGFECLVVSDATGSYFPEFQRIGLEMIKAQGGIFGWVAPSSAVLEALGA